MADTRDSTNDAALEILKRLEPVLTRIAADTAGLKTDVAGLTTDVAGLKTDVAGLKKDVNDIQKRLANIDGQLTHMPTAIGITLTILIAVIANGAATAAIVFAVLNYAKAIR